MVDDQNAQPSPRNSNPLDQRNPLGKAENSLEFVAPALGLFQYSVQGIFILPPATSEPPKYNARTAHSELLGTCQPDGHNLPVFTVYQL